MINQKFQHFIHIVSCLTNEKSEIVSESLKSFEQLEGLIMQYKYKSLKYYKPIEILGQNLPYLKNLNYFELIIEYQEVIKNQADYAIQLGDGLKELINLKRFSLNIQQTSQLDREGAKQIRLGLNNCKMLTYLQFCFQFDNNINYNQIMKQLCKGYRYLYNLTHLDIQIRTSPKILKDNLLNISNNLKFLSNLNTLQLKLTIPNPTSTQNLLQLGAAILNLKNLTHVHLELFDRYAQQDSQIQLLNKLFLIEKLEVLFVSFIFNIGELNQNFYIGQTISENNSIRKLTLEFYNISTKIENTIYFHKNIQYLSKLSYLNILMSQILFNDINIEMFSNILQFFQSLEQLNIQFTINHLMFPSLISQISKLQNLNELTLNYNFNVEQSCIDYETFNDIQSLQNLQKLKIITNSKVFQQLNNNPIISQNVFQQLKELSIVNTDLNSNYLSVANLLLQGQQNLIKLELEFQIFNNNQNILYLLLNNFKHLTCLKFLSINLQRKKNSEGYIEQEFQIQLIQAIKQFKNLIELKLSIQIENNQKSISLQEILNSLQCLYSLRKVNILNQNCNKKISNKVYSRIIRKNKYLVTLVK